MGRRGPRPKPAALKLLAGNPGKRGVSPNPGGGRVRKGIPARPPELTGVASETWDATAAELDAAGMLSVADAPALAAYCCAYADMLAARAEITKSGRWLTVAQQNSKGEVLGDKVIEHPAVKTLRQATKDVATLAAALGLTPAARARFDGPAEGEPKGNAVVALRERIQQARAGG